MSKLPYRAVSDHLAGSGAPAHAVPALAGARRRAERAQNLLDLPQRFDCRGSRTPGQICRKDPENETKVEGRFTRHGSDG